MDKQEEEKMYKVCKCFNCGETNYYDSQYCKKCGVINVVYETLCPSCKEPVKNEDEKCFVCGAKFTHSVLVEVVMSHFYEEEKNNFIESINKKSYQIEISFFKKTILEKLNSYPTVKLLLSENCPDELQKFFQIKKIENMTTKLEDIAKKYFEVAMNTPLIAGKYVNLVESIIAYVGEKRIEQDEQIRNAIKVILKTTDRYYRSLAEIPADEEAQKHIYKNWILIYTLLINYELEREKLAGVISVRAGLMYRLGEIYRKNGEIEEEFEHLYVNSILENISAVSKFWFDGDYKNANGLLERVSELIIQFEREIKTISVFEFADRIFTFLHDSTHEVAFYPEVSKGYIVGIEIALRLLSQLMQREDWNEEARKSIVKGRMIVEKLNELDPNKLTETKIIEEIVKILIKYHSDNIEKFTEYFVKLTGKNDSKVKENVLHLVIEQVNRTKLFSEEEKEEVEKTLWEKMKE